MGDLAGWPYWKVISITGQSGAGTDYQVELEIGDSAGGDFHLEGHCTNFPQDIRITDDDGTTLLDHWVEDIAADPIVVHVKVNDNLDSNQTIRVYYGKSGETTDSNINTTFIDVINSVHAAWNFDGNSLDESGNSNDCSLGGDAGYTTGVYGQALDLDGSGDYALSESNSGITGSAVRTISFRAKSGITDYATDGYPFNLNSLTTGSNQLFGIRVAYVSDTWKFTDGAAARDTGVSVTTSWIQLVATLDGSKNLNVYINNVITDIENINLPSINTSAGPVTIGALHSSVQYFNGIIDQVRIYDNVLTSDERLALYNNYGYVTTNHPGYEMVKKYNSPEPAFSSAGAEQTPTVGAPMWYYDMLRRRNQ